MNRERNLLALLCGLGLCGSAAGTDSQKDSRRDVDSDSAYEAVDETLFEFLGSWDADDETVTEFLDSVPELEDYELGVIEEDTIGADSDSK